MIKKGESEMHFDLAHALVTVFLIFAVVVGLRKAGLYVPHNEGGPRFSWSLFFGIGIAVFILNLIWP